MTSPLRPNIWPDRLNSANREIRLLVLEPSEDPKALPRGQLITTSLNHHPRYIAFSYAWGTCQPSLPLYIDGIRWPITKHLCQGLMAARHRSRKQAFWLDAVSVNQHDLEERAEQVQLMQSTFSDAIRVHVWLGAGSRTLVCAMLDVIRLTDLHVETDEPAIATTELISDEQHFQVLDHFTTLDWWNRLWVMQEMMLARDVVFQYESVTISRHSLQTFVGHCASQLSRDPSTALQSQLASVWRFNVLTSMSNLLDDALGLSPSDRFTGLLDILCRSRFSEVSDPKDRVYGLLGICTALFGQEFMRPDYTLSTTRIFEEFAVALLIASESLALLGQASALHNSLTNLPSFVPDWTSFYDFDLERRRVWTYNLYNASGGLKPTVLDNEDPGILILEWTPFTHAKWIFKQCEHGVSSDERVATLEQWQDEYLSWAMDAGLSENTQGFHETRQAFVATLVRGCDRDSQSRLPPDFSWNADAALVDLIIPNEDPTEPWIAVSTGNSRFFITGSGHPALGPINMQESDVIALLCGGKVPYVLRKAADRKDEDELDSYYFIGECYVHGAMDGEKCPPNSHRAMEYSALHYGDRPPHFKYWDQVKLI